MCEEKEEAAWENRVPSWAKAASFITYRSVCFNRPCNEMKSFICFLCVTCTCPLGAKDVEVRWMRAIILCLIPYWLCDPQHDAQPPGTSVSSSIK